jgi:flagellar basal body-associated protein FliL
MSDKKAEATDSAPETNTGPKESKLPLLVSLINTVAILAAVGLLAYTKLVFKRPKITEETERASIEKMKAEKPSKPMTPATIVFDPTTINISSSPEAPKPQDGTQTQLGGKLHYATVGFALEIDDADKKADVETIRPLITDHFLTLMGHKQFHELTSVQGRYILKSQVLEIANQLWAKRQSPNGENVPASDPLFTNLYFTQFIVQ